MATLTGTLNYRPDAKEMEEMRRELTLRPRQLSALSDPYVMEAFSVGDDGVCSVPKAWGLERHTGDVADRQIVPTPVSFDSLAVAALRPHQERCAAETVAHLESGRYGGGGLVSMPCGYGKSVTALEIARRLGVRALIICHTSVLRTQWEATIRQYLPDAVVGRVFQDVCEVEGATHIVGSLHSIAKRREYDFAGVGLAVWDEVRETIDHAMISVALDGTPESAGGTLTSLVCASVDLTSQGHHVPAVTFSQSVANLAVRYKLVLSATPTRPDGLSSFLRLAFGDFKFVVAPAKRHDLRAYFVLIENTPVVFKGVRKGGQIVANVAGMISCLSDPSSPKAVARQEIAARWIRLCVSKGRKVIVVADRVALLKDLAERAGVESSSFLLGETKRAAREVAGEASVIYGTYGIVSEGLDIPSADTCLLLSPRSGANVITQVVGRLFRTGGRPPVVIDFVDGIEVFEAMARKREVVYRRMGAVITRYDERREIVG